MVNMWTVICILCIMLDKFGHSLPRSDCLTSPSSKKCKGSNDQSSFNRQCSSYFDCKFQPEGCESSAWFECDGSQCTCELFGFARDDFGPLKVNWDPNQKGGLCTIRRGGPCGRDDGLNVKCETGYQCIDSQCMKMPQKQSTKGGCGQAEGCEFGSVTPPCPDPDGCEFGRVPHGQSSEFIGRGNKGNKAGGNGRGRCDERMGSCENRALKEVESIERPKGKPRQRQESKPKRLEMESSEMETGRMPRGRESRGSGSGSIFPPSSFRSPPPCGKKDSESCESDDRGSAKPESQGCGKEESAGGCGGGRPKLGPRPNAPKPCKEGNCGGGRRTTTTPPPTTRKPKGGCGGSGGCGRKTTTTTTKAPCGGNKSGGCGKKTTERADRPPCGGNGNSGCGNSGGGGRRSSQPPKRRPTEKPAGGGCRSENGCGGGGASEKPKRPGPSPCGSGSLGCEAEVPKSKPGCNKGSSGCRTTTTTTTPKPSCKESNSCEGEEEEEENRCDKFFPKMFNTKCGT